MRVNHLPAVLFASAVVAATGTAAISPQADMTIFITSAGSGKVADLGGLDRPDRHCTQLAVAAGAISTGWRAYLSAQATDGAPGVNARERIGSGPWQDAKGEVISRNVVELHNGNNLDKQAALKEKGEPVNGRCDTPNMHDILTGSQPDGTAFAAGEDRTCGNCTPRGAEGAAMVGHHDRMA